MNTIELLPDEFVGIREVSGFKFRKVYTNDSAYVFQVNFGDNHHYETIKRILTPKCLDFTKRIYSETEFKESYPNSKSFGRTGFSYAYLDLAIKKADEINQNEKAAEETDYGETDSELE